MLYSTILCDWKCDQLSSHWSCWSRRTTNVY